MYCVLYLSIYLPFLEQAKLDEFIDVVSGGTADNSIHISNEHDPLEIVFDETDSTTYCERILNLNIIMSIHTNVNSHFQVATARLHLARLCKR